MRYKRWLLINKMRWQKATVGEKYVGMEGKLEATSFCDDYSMKIHY